MKKFLILFLVFLFLLPTVVFCEDQPISVIINDCPLACDVPAQIIDGRTMLPVRAIFEALGMIVSWEDSTKTIIGKGYDYTVIMHIGDPEIRYYLETEITEESSYLPVTADVPPQILSGRTLIPVRALAEALDAEVTWEESTRTVRIEQTIFPLMTADGGYTIDGNNARFIGRYYERFDRLWSSFSASGIELRFRGTKAKITFDVAGNEDAYLHAYVDGNETFPTDYSDDDRVLFAKGSNREYVLCEGLPDGIHTVKIIKANEDLKNQIGWGAFYTDGELLAPPISKTRKIQVFGDSITCACCNMNFPENTSDLGEAKYQDAHTSYASFVADHFDADLEIFARSGLSAYASFYGVEDPAYDHVSQTYPNYGVWNHDRYSPDLIIQFNWINEYVGKIQRDGVKNTVIQSIYVTMLEHFRKVHPNAKLLIISNQSAKPFTTIAQNAVNEYVKKTGDTVPIVVFESKIPYPHHPFSATHKEIAEEMEPVIAELMGW